MNAQLGHLETQRAELEEQANRQAEEIGRLERQAESITSRRLTFGQNQVIHSAVFAASSEAEARAELTSFIQQANQIAASRRADG